MSKAEWIPARLAECVATINSGVSVNSDDRPRGPGEVGVLKTSAVSAGSFKAHENKVVAKRDRSRVAESVLGGSVLFSRMNTPQLVGESCYIEADDPSLFLPDRLWQIRVDSSRVDARWLSYVLLEPRVASEIKGLATGTSGSMKNIARSSFLGISVLVPPIGEQRRIAEILDTLDDRICATERMVSKLGSLQIGLMQSLLGTRPIGVPSGGAVPVPKGWTSATLAKVVGAPITYGIVQAGPHIPDGVPYVRTGDMSGDELSIDGMLRTSRRIADEYARSTVHAGELVCAIRATVGKVLPVPPELDGANLTQGIARIAPGRNVDPRFLYWEMRGDRVQRQIALAIKGTTFLEITLAALRQIRVAMPDIQKQRKIASALDANDSLLQQEKEHLGHLRMFRQGLATDLLTGRVRVSCEITS